MRRTLLGRRDGEQRPDRHDRFPPPAQGRMSVAARDDPITGLVAWPAFHEALPGLLRRQLGDGRAVGLAIGDVDDLKTYVERVRSVDAGSFGHLAGNALMQQLGIVARAWLRESGPSDACLATFGGDEIVLLGLAADQRAFIEAVSGLRDVLGESLPCTVSFAAAVVTPEHIPTPVAGDHWWAEFTRHLLSAVERTLFEFKQVRRGDPDAVPRGFVAPTAVARPPGGRR